MNKLQRGQWPWRLALFSLAATALIGLSLIFFAQPLNDDFSRALAPRSGWFAYIAALYHNWSGRWAGVGLSAFVLPRVDLTRHYVLLLGALHLAQWLAFLIFWRLLLGPRVPWRRLALYSLATYAVLWSAAPAPGETYYWFSGGVEYSLSLSLAIVLLGALIRASSRAGAARWGWATLSGALAVIVGGMHEIVGVTLCVLLAAGVFVAIRRRQGVAAWSLVLLLALAGVLIELRAPGNAKRAATFEHYGSLLLTIRTTLSLVRFHLIPWSRKPVLLAVAAVLLLTPIRGARRPEWSRWAGIPWHWIFPAVTVVVVAASLAGPTWAMGSVNGRCLDATQSFFLLGGAASVVAWGHHLHWLRGVWGRRTRDRLRLAALLVLAVSLWPTGNTRRALVQLATTLPAWSRTLRQQQDEARLARAQGQMDALVPAVAVERPSLFFEDGIGPDPQDWRNQHFAAYFGLKTIRTRTDLEFLASGS